MHSSAIYFEDRAHEYVKSVLEKYHSCDKIKGEIEQAWKDPQFEGTASLMFYDDIEDETTVIILADTSVLVTTFNGLPESCVRLAMHVSICHFH